MAAPAVDAALFCRPQSRQEVLYHPNLYRGILGVIDGASPKGVEDEAGRAWRHDLLRKIGYKK